MLKQLFLKMVLGGFRKKFRKKLICTKVFWLGVPVFLLWGCAAQLPHEDTYIGQNCSTFLLGAYDIELSENKLNLKVGLAMFEQFGKFAPELLAFATANGGEDAEEIGSIFSDFCFLEGATVKEASLLTHRTYINKKNLK